ncbi:phosphate ABC transporter substrate-binding protein [Coraliomargarita sp. SDUM461004]|uniref:Phosphate-binding protein n=1 Tax=Thalassobacterium sedimentorum TaxID=3041258 RepID=A0ABU1AHK5_9BACT|nr:phosphate ABC transporter substrate-binding protein [Coraliomargarita sp. SDUM461004]MDQ8194304.1 phosphate ABC transporter substrate-binding protein [Coraliomargarita sp. SDUM461004]
MNTTSILRGLTAALCMGFAGQTSSLANVDPNLPVYESVSGVSGNLNSIGSDTLNNLMTLWAEGFEAIYPNVNIQIEGKGSSTAPPALIEGTAQIGPMSREMKGSEMDAFEARYGYKPTAVGTSIDALAVFVNKDNPLESITSEQIDSVFSSTYRKGGTPITEWSQLGLEGSLGGRALSLYGRNSASGTYGFFKKVALAGGDFSSSVKEQPGSSSVVQGIGSDLAGIGYSGIGYTTSGVKAIQIDGVEPTAENCLDGSYPLARQLFVYVNRDPREPMDKLTYEFLRFVLSKQGQEVVEKDGYYPLPAPVAEQILNSLK